MPSFFLDTADRARAEPLLRTGLFDGLTTNPSILDKSGLGSSALPDVVAWASDAGAGKVFVQAWGLTPSELIDRGEWLRGLGSTVVVKVPASAAGVEAARRLSVGGPVLITALYSASQVLPAMAAGAAYVAPFVSRITGSGQTAIDEVLTMQAAVDAAGATLEILAGSLRTPEQILRLAVGGVRNMTFGPDVWEMFFDSEGTAASVARFESLAGNGR